MSPRLVVIRPATPGQAGPPDFDRPLPERGPRAPPAPGRPAGVRASRTIGPSVASMPSDSR